MTTKFEGVTWNRLGEDTSDELYTNIIHRVKHHSPTGFNVGYAGSGPADFALNIVQLRLEQLKFDGEITRDTWNKQWMFKDVWEVYQIFKSWFLVDADIMYGQISWEAVDDFLKGCSSPNIRAFMHGEEYKHHHICKNEMMLEAGEEYKTLLDLTYPIFYCGECFEEHIRISTDPDVFANLAAHRSLVKDIYDDE